MFVKGRSLWVVVSLIAIFGASVPVGQVSAQSSPMPSRAPIPTNVPSPILPIVPTVAPGYRAPNVAPTSATIAGVAQQPFVGISLEDAIGMALLKNPNLAVSSSNARVAGYQVVETKGAFDTRLQVQPTSSMSVQPPTIRSSRDRAKSGTYSARRLHRPIARLAQPCRRCSRPDPETSSSISTRSNTAWAARR